MFVKTSFYLVYFLVFLEGGRDNSFVCLSDERWDAGGGSSHNLLGGRVGRWFLMGL